MKQVIMVREKIIESKEWLIDPEHSSEEIKEVWHHDSCEPFWNEYYRVAIFDDEKYEEEYQALCEEGRDFYNFEEAKAYYNELKKEIGE